MLQLARCDFDACNHQLSDLDTANPTSVSSEQAAEERQHSAPGWRTQYYPHLVRANLTPRRISWSVSLTVTVRGEAVGWGKRAKPRFGGAARRGV